MASTLYDLYQLPLPDNPSWVSGGVVPKGGIVVMGGPPKIGKTFLQLDLAHAIAAGGSLWGTEYEVKATAPVLIMEREVGVYEFQRRVKMRYRQMGQPPPRNIYFTSKMKGLLLDTSEGAGLLQREIDHTRAGVVIIDPVSMAMAGEENSNTDVQRLISNLKDMQVDYPDVTFVLLHHYGKIPKGRDLDTYDPLDPQNFRGAIKWVDAADTLITFERVEARGAQGVWWKLNARFLLRQGPSPKEDIRLAVMDGGLINRASSGGEAAGAGRWGKK
jgi:hypothetical protein